MTETAATEIKPLGADPPELETLEIEVDGQIGTLTLNRPDALNAMSPELIGELTTAAAWLADRAPIRALIITGAGPRLLLGRGRQLVQAGRHRRGGRPALRGAPRRRGAAQRDRRHPPDPLSGDRGHQRARRRAPACRWRSRPTSGSPRRTPSWRSPTGGSAPPPTAA